MRLAEHFAVGAVGGAALAPGGHVVGFYLREFEMLFANGADSLFAFVRLDFMVVGKRTD